MEKGWRWRAVWLAGLISALLLVSACNDSDSTPPADTGSTTDNADGTGSEADNTGDANSPGGNSGDGSAGVPVVGDTGRTGFILTHQAMPDERFVEINLTIIAIELLSDSMPAVSIFTGEQRINLLSVNQLGRLMALADQVPVGVYNKIRLTLKQPAGLELIPAGGGDPVYPPLPGNGKIDLNPRSTFEVVTDGLLMLQLDLDAGKSIHVTGTESNVQFRPVVFISELADGQKSNLLRIHGFAHSIVDSTGTLTFCLDPLPEVTTDVVTSCLPVSIADASLFNRDAVPALATDIATGDPLTVVGLVEGFSGALGVNAGVTSIEPIITGSTSAGSTSASVRHDDDDDDKGAIPVSTETRLLAEVVEINAVDARFRLQAIIKTALGTADEVFVFDSLRAGEVSGLNISGQLQPGARILDRNATRYDFTSITVGRMMGLDGAPSLVGEVNAMKVTLALLSDENGTVLPDQIDGVIQSISATDGILMLNDVMVTVGANTLIIKTSELDGVLVSFSASLVDLVEGSQASIFGQSQVDGSFVADVILSGS